MLDEEKVSFVDKVHSNFCTEKKGINRQELSSLVDPFNGSTEFREVERAEVKKRVNGRGCFQKTNSLPLLPREKVGWDSVQQAGSLFSA